MENGASSPAEVKEVLKCSAAIEQRSTAAMAGFAGSGAAGAVGGAGAAVAVGRLVDSSQAEDRRLIRAVRARRLLYARNNMPVASYYAHCKQLWQEVADNCGRSVAEVRRKWSHIRNSYSRHLRNEVLGARTGRGRCVSRWYLADELAFLRDHMATDTRIGPYSQHLTAAAGAAPELTESEGEGVGGHSPLWAGAGGGGGGGGDSLLQPKVEAVYAASEEDSAGSVGGAEGAEGADGDGDGEGEGCGSLAAFFRPLQGEWAGLRARRRRLFLRQSLALLHALLDEQDAELLAAHQQPLVYPHPLPHPHRHEHEHEPEHSILPNE